MERKTHILLYTLIPAIAIVVLVSFSRFILVHNYTVSYEGPCDPLTEVCFVGCEDDECTEEYYYSIVQRNARAIRKLCGADISDCPAADTCPNDEGSCSITYCDPEIDTDMCESIEH